MAIVGLLNFKTDLSIYFDVVDNFLEQCRSVNLLINAQKTKEMALSFSRSYAIYMIICVLLAEAYILENLNAQFYPKTCRFTENRQSRHVLGLKSGQNLVNEQIQSKIKAIFELSIPKKPYNNLLFDHIDEFESFFILGSTFELSSPT